MWTVIDEKWCGSVAAVSYSLLEYSKIPRPYIAHLLAADKLNLSSNSNKFYRFDTRISLSRLFPLPIGGKEREKEWRGGRTIKQRTVGWIVGTWPKSGYLRTAGWGKIRQWITGPLYVASYYSLFHTMLETRRVTQIPNTCAAFCREVCTEGTRGVSERIYTSPPIFPSWKAQQQWQGHGEHDVWRVLVHKIRLVSLKPVVQDIGRAYIKNRHRDEWIPENPVVASFPNNVSRGTRPLFFDCYRCCIARGYRCRLIFWISLVIFATNLYLHEYVYRSL